MKKEEIKEILDNFKNNYDELGSCYYPEDILGPEDLKLLYDYITNLQEENEYSNHCNEELRKKITNLEYKIERLEEDNKQLKELCDKYEEEHNTTFIEWQKDINIIDELEKWLNEYYESNRKWYNTELSNYDRKYYEREYRNTEFMIVKFKKQLNILKGDE